MADGNTRAGYETPKPKSLDNSAQVDAFLARLEHPLKAELEAVRAIILSANPAIAEGVKWNAPSFYCRGDFATFNLRAEGHVLLVLHRGAKAKADSVGAAIEDDAGLLEWVAKDRCLLRFYGLDDIAAKKDALQAVVNQWLADE